jgi:K+ transporter
MARSAGKVPTAEVNGLSIIRPINPAAVFAVNGFFLSIDLVFFASNCTKLLEGGWFPLVIAGLVAFLLKTWRRGVRPYYLVPDGKVYDPYAVIRETIRSLDKVAIGRVVLTNRERQHCT